MFAHATKRFVRNVAPGGPLVPNTKLHDSRKINCLQLVIVKRGSFFRRRSKHRFTDITLNKLLVDQELIPELEDRDYNISGYMDTVDARQEGRAEVDHQACKIGTNVERSKHQEVTFPRLKTQTTNMDKLLCSDSSIMVNRRVPQLREGEVLMFVTERIYTAESGEITGKKMQKEGASMALKKIQHLMAPGVSAELKADSQGNTSFTVKAGTVLAYSLRKMVLQDKALQFDPYDFEDSDFCTDGPGNDCCDPELNTETQQFMVIQESLPSDYTSPDSIDTLELVQKELREMEVPLKPLADLPESTRSALFQNFCEVLKDREALSELDETLDQWCDAEACDLPKNQSARGIMDVLRSTSGRADTTPLLKACHLLVDTMDTLPDPVQSMLARCSPDILRGLNTLVSSLEANDQSPPTKSLPLPLQEGGEFHWATELLCSTNETLGELAELCAETGDEPGVFLLALCVTVQGLNMMHA